MAEFQPWPKIARFNRETIITEKIDGTNAAIVVEPVSTFGDLAGVEDPFRLATVLVQPREPADLTSSTYVGVYAQSRTRFITPGTGREAGNDNAGFAAWVTENAKALVDLLGPGRHFGEWYGKGIGRGYGLDHKRFALFNVHRWGDGKLEAEMTSKGVYINVDVVPILLRLEKPSVAQINLALAKLETSGSVLVPGFERPEGVVLYHTAAKTLFKILLEHDELPKDLIPRAERQQPDLPGMWESADLSGGWADSRA